MRSTASYDDLLSDMLRDEERARAYLNAALEEQDQRVFLIALRNITRAQGGIAKVAERSGLNRESLYRALSEKGNPSIQTLDAVLKALGAQLAVTSRKRSLRRRPLFSGTWAAGRRPIYPWQSMSSSPAVPLPVA
jgi:probable addiction module antidote protein